MSVKILLTLFLSFISFSSFPQTSAVRDPLVPYETYEGAMPKSRAETVLSVAKYYTGENLPETTNWASLDILQERFDKILNVRFLKWSRRPDFPRRISWLYPNDGCYARAAVANAWFEKNNVEVPGKVFAFGELKVDTENHPQGEVYWWYHVAPIVEVQGVKYVIDPSIDHKGALKLDEWLSKMGNPSKMKVSICKAGAYVPASTCSDVNTQGEGDSTEASILNWEWDQLIKMKLNPEELLGESPPWE